MKTEAILGQGAAAPEANPASTLADATCEVLSIGDALQFLADAEHEAVPSGLAHMLRALARRAHDVGVALDEIKLDEVAI